MRWMKALKGERCLGRLSEENALICPIMVSAMFLSLKFTEIGWVKLKIDSVRSPLAIDDDVLREAENIIAFSVIDTGIGIAKDKQKIIFEAF